MKIVSWVGINVYIPDKPSEKPRVKMVSWVGKNTCLYLLSLGDGSGSGSGMGDPYPE